jgi:diadenylate cyclase
LSTYTLNLTLQNIRTLIVAFLDIFIMWLIFYYALKIVRSNSRTIQIFKGIILIVVIDGIAKLLGLKTLQFFTDMFINWGFLAIIIIFQPELRSLLERIGKTNVFSRITTLTGNEKEHLVDQIVTAVMLLSKDSTGALISIEQAHSLDDFISTGTTLNSDVTAELLTSIFVTSTPLHDGAVIIQGDKIACASAYFPPTNLELPSRYGARHRAAIGISEITDAVTIVVSEETGTVSITEGGKIFVMHGRTELRDYLMRVICGEVTEVKTKHLNSEFDETGTVPAGTKKRENVLSKFALNKQAPNTSDKIETESVVPAKIEEIHKQADQEARAAEIKLPHKKDRPEPSYPQQVERAAVPGPVEETLQPEQLKKLTAQPLPPMEEKVPSSASDSMKPGTKMTPEEVKAAREAAMERYSHRGTSTNKNGGDKA